MALINFAHREITAKVVYFGAPKAGCNTNVQVLHEIVRAYERSRLHEFGPGEEEERTRYFDYVPEGTAPITGFSTRFRVYSMPGGLLHPVHRGEVLKGTDAVVFIADARAGKDQTNVDALLELERSLAEQGIEMGSLPMVIQVNHTDDDTASSPEDVTRDLNPYGFPVIQAVARDTIGVLETHKRIIGVTISRIRDNLSGNETSITLTAVHRATRDRDEDIIQKHIEAIAHAEHTTQTTGDYAKLPRGTEYEIPFQPRDFAGMRPVELRSTSVEGDRIVVDIVMERLSGGQPRVLPLVLANRPTDAAPLPSVVTASHTPAPLVSVSPTASLPDKIELNHGSYSTEMHEVAQDVSLWIGVAGTFGGLVAGLLLGFLFWG
ncbi:MAG: hypothetical protein EP330_19475 [Deltaproteobacteria bacterium]|nr:MAG: hypothetical protein EP330_19475 [Deltaproteobacteria bacterium]